MLRFSGSFWELVVYEGQTTGSLFREQVWYVYLFEENLLDTFSSSYNMSSAR